MSALRPAGFLWAAVCVALAAGACGGGGGGGGTPPRTYSISGTISGSVLDGVLVTLSGAGSATTTTSGGGVYTFTGLADGTYTVTPSRAGYAFVPPSVTVTVSGAGATGQSFAAAATYAPADLAGSWEIHDLASGPGAPWWFRGRAAIAADGSFTGTFDDNGGTSGPSSGTFGLTAQDELTLSVNASARGSLDLDRTVMAFTATWATGSPGTTELGVALKAATSYAAADLAGTWESNSLATGPGAPWWERARAVIAADGSFTADTTESDGSTGTLNAPAGSLVLSADGVITGPGDFRGAMDAGKTVVAITDTWTTGSPGTTEMKLWVKVGASYVPADLAGTWKGFGIASGSDEPWWERLDLTVAANGSWNSSAAYSDGSSSTATGSATISAGGVVSITGQPSLRGVMDAGKTVIVTTETWPVSSGTTTQLQILVRVR